MAKLEAYSFLKRSAFKLDPRVPLVLGAAIFAFGAEMNRRGDVSGIWLLALGLLFLLPAAFYRFLNRPTLGEAASSSRRIRRTVVVLSYACVFVGLGVCLFAPWGMPFVIGLATGAGGLVLLATVLRAHLTWGNASTADLDVYQRARRSHATAVAYGVILALFWIALVVGYVARISLSHDQLGACVLTLGLLAITGPGAVLAWLEPDFSEEQ